MVKIEKKQSKQSAKIYNMSDDEIATYIGYKGYAIYKENISVEEQQMLRKELNVKPFVPKNSLIKPQPFQFTANPKVNYMYQDFMVWKYTGNQMIWL